MDGNSVRVPISLQDLPEPTHNGRPFILDSLHDAANQIIEVVLKTKIRLLDSHVDVMDLILGRDSIALHEFELIQLTLRWCKRNEES